MFDDTRAKTYIRGALCLAIRSNEPVIYLKPSWGTGGKDKTVSPELATFLQKGMDGRVMAGIPADDEMQQMLFKGLSGLGFGCQVMSGPHYAMAAGPGDLYGCALNKEGDNPLAYKQAIRNNQIDHVIEMFRGLGYEEIQLRGIRFALECLAIKIAPIRAYLITEADVAGGLTVETIIDGKVESVSTPKAGDWLVKQASGEIMPIKADKWEALGYIEYKG